MIVYSNSDSYGVMSTGLRYSDFLAQALDAKCVNGGKEGSCNQRILRTTVRDLVKLRQQTDEPILCLLCLGSLVRGEWWNEATRPRPTETDGHFESFQIYAIDNPDHPARDYMHQWYRVYNDEAVQTDLMLQLTLLTSWLTNNNIEYIAFAGNNRTYKKIDYNDVFIKDFATPIFADKNILNLNNFSFVAYCLEQGHKPFDYDRWKESGHHGEPAHRDFANFLLKYYHERRH
jgi:hypothetical protein